MRVSGGSLQCWRRRCRRCLHGLPGNVTLYSDAGRKTGGQWDSGGEECVCVCVCVCMCQIRRVLMSSFVHDSHRRRTFLCVLCSVWPHRSVLFVCGLYVSTSLCCWCCAVTLTVVSGSHVHIVNIPTSISVKWESGPECPSSDCGHDLQCYSYW